MKHNSYAVIMIAALGLSIPALTPAQNLLVNGDFESGATGWTEVNLSAGTQPTVVYNSTDLPTGGNNNALRITGTGVGGGINPTVGVYQAVNLTEGHSYTISGVTKDLGSSVSSGAWAEVFVGTTDPQTVAGSDYTDGQRVVFNAWDCSGWDADFSTDCGGNAQNGNFVAPSTGTFYFMIKAGCWDANVIDASFDELVLTDNGSIFGTPGPNLLSNGDFSQGATGWTETNLSAGPQPTVVYNSTDLPAGGSGEAIRITGNGTGGGINPMVAVHQEVALTAGRFYTITGVTKDLGSSVGSGAWAEIYVGTTAPVVTEDYTSGGKRVGFDAWNCSGWDADFSADCGGNAQSDLFQATTTGTHYFVIKAGCWDANIIDVSFDDLSIADTDGGSSSIVDWSMFK